MIRSRTTLASTDAAAIESIRASPDTIACCGSVTSGMVASPSTSTRSGTTLSRAKARAADVHPVDRPGAEHRPRKCPGLDEDPGEHLHPSIGRHLLAVVQAV